jgi:broad specificity phosphatase PhoE
MKQLLFMRHGESEMNARGLFGGAQPHIQLTALGRQQAELAGNEYLGTPIDIIVASNLDRAQDTAKLFAAGINFPIDKIKTDARLHEIDVGALTGQPDHGFGEGLKYLASRVDPTAETPEAVMARIKDFLVDFIPAVPADSTVLMVAHAGIARVMRSLLTPVPLLDIAETTIPNAEPFELPLTNLTDILT